MGIEQDGRAMTKKRKIRVLMVEDTKAVRTNLSAFLLDLDDLELVGDATSGKRAINLIDRLKPDVVLLGLVLEGMDGLTTMRKIHSKYPQTKVIVMAPGNEMDQVEAAMAAGAAGFIRQEFMAEEMECAIRAVYNRRQGTPSKTGGFYSRVTL
jgi:NarL family two-component system response regulator LiaR